MLQYRIAYNRATAAIDASPNGERTGVAVTKEDDGLVLFFNLVAPFRAVSPAIQKLDNLINSAITLTNALRVTTGGLKHNVGLVRNAVQDELAETSPVMRFWHRHRQSVMGGSRSRIMDLERDLGPLETYHSWLHDWRDNLSRSKRGLEIYSRSLRNARSGRTWTISQKSSKDAMASWTPIMDSISSKLADHLTAVQRRKELEDRAAKAVDARLLK